MKFGCRVDGIHFKQDFEKTFIPPCDFWGDLGMGNLPKELKKKFWDWIFAMPADEIGLKCKIGISVSFQTAPIMEDSQYINMIEGYKDLSEEEQQNLQRKIALKQKKGEDIVSWIRALGKVGKKKFKAD